MSFVKIVYNTLFRRTSSYALTIVATAFFFERTVDVGLEYVFDQINKGKQWKDIKHRYVE